jgi:hypothetical protein
MSLGTLMTGGMVSTSCPCIADKSELDGKNEDIVTINKAVRHDVANRNISRLTALFRSNVEL